MAKPVQWLARMLGLGVGDNGDDGVSSFEHVDGSRLSADEFHQSDSMRLDGVIVRDFAETLPSYSLCATPLAGRVPRLAALTRPSGQNAH